MSKRPTEAPDNPDDSGHLEERPPFFSSWRAWYFIVLANLVVLIILFAIFTEVFK